MMAAMEPARKSVLIQWVKKYKDTNGGQLPKPGSLPSELAATYTQWLASIRDIDVEVKSAAWSVLIPPGSTQMPEESKKGSTRLDGRSSSLDTHVSETPCKCARSQKDAEFTSRLTTALPLFHDDYQGEPQKQCRDLPSSSNRSKAYIGRAEDSSKIQRRKRAPKQENQENNEEALDSIGKASSPIPQSLRSPLLQSRGPTAQNSPSRVRQGAVKRKVNFSLYSWSRQQSSLAPTKQSVDEAPTEGVSQRGTIPDAPISVPWEQPQPRSAELSVQQPQERTFLVQNDELLRKKHLRRPGEEPTSKHGPCSLAKTDEKDDSRGTPTERDIERAQRAVAATEKSTEKFADQEVSAMKRKRKGSNHVPGPSGCEASLICSEDLSSKTEGERSESGSESEQGSERVHISACHPTKRARPAAKKGLTAAELKQRLSERGLSTIGRKAELEQRLQQAGQQGCMAASQGPCSSAPVAAEPVQLASTKNTSCGKHASKGMFKGGRRKNFVRINLKGPSAKGKFRSKGAQYGKKSFSRFGRFRTKMLPQAGQGADYVEGCSNRSMSCFKCGANGHWARDCPGLPEPAAKADPGTEGAGEGSPRIVVAAEAAPPSAPAAPRPAVALPEDAMTEAALTKALQHVFGFTAFQGLQLPIIQSVLRGTSTLAVLPTGAGKSLCYQVPALLCGGLVLVVSPLIALMKDQLAHLPKGLPGAMLWSGQQAAQAMQTLRDVREGCIRVLYVAPERMCSPSLLSALAPMLPLPLVCIDEAHCIAEWGHNFRSAYFRLGRVLRENVPCRAVLALTATATKATEASMVQALGIAPSCVFRDDSLRDNLRFHMHHTNGGTEAGYSKGQLLKLLKSGGALADKKAVVVFTTFQVQAEQVAAHLHSHGIPAAAYHAGKHFKERESVQEMFGKGQLRVVVATVAFGMGIDFGGVQAVVHLTLPQSLEEYVQQVGRAGRDGREAQCHLFLDDADFRRLRSLSHSDAVSAASVLQFLEAVFPEDDDSEDGAPKEGHRCYAVLGADEMACSLDMKAEVMETLLTYLEAHEESYVRLLSSVGRTVKVSFFNSSCQALSARQPLLQSLLLICPKPRGGNFTVNMARWANAARMAPSELLQQLAALARQDELRFEVDPKPTLTFQVLKRPAELDDLAEALAKRHTEVGSRRLRRLDTIYKTLAAAAALPDQAAQEQHIREVATRYFEAEDDSGAEGQRSGAGGMEGLPLVAGSSFMAKDMRMLLRESASMKMGAQMTGRAIARILHGLQSSAFPAAQWKKCGYWARYVDVDFDAVLAIAEAEVGAWSK